MAALEKLLERLYYNPLKSSAYSSLRNLYNEAKKLNKRITLKFVRDWASKQETITLHKPARKRYKRSKTLGSGYMTHVQVDLADMSSLRHKNSGFAYFLTIVDCYSRKIFAIPLKTKRGEEVVEAFKSVFTTLIPMAIISDQGREFFNRSMEAYCKANEIQQYSPRSEVKASMAERANRTVKARLYKYFTANKTQRWVEAIKDITDGINASVNRSIGMTPNDVQPNSFLYRHEKSDGTQQLLKVGDLIRLSRQRSQFEKSYLQSFTTEMFTISEVIDANPPYYRIKDLEGNLIEGRIFKEEIVKVTRNDEPVYKIEKILQRRRRNGREELFVLWDDKTRSWIPANDLVFL